MSIVWVWVGGAVLGAWMVANGWWMRSLRNLSRSLDREYEELKRLAAALGEREGL